MAESARLHSASSTKAHNGSANGSSTHEASYPPSTSNGTHISSKQVDRYVADERDHRSYAVEEYDPHQEAAKKRKRESLKEVVDRRYL